MEIFLTQNTEYNSTRHLVERLISNQLLKLTGLQDLIHRFLDQAVDPDTAVCRNEVHQSKLGNNLIFVDVEPGVHEDVVHLHEGADHLQHRVGFGENIPARAVVRSLERIDKLQSSVDESSQSEANGSKSHQNTPVALLTLRGHELDDHLSGRFVLRVLSIDQRQSPRPQGVPGPPLGLPHL